MKPILGYWKIRGLAGGIRHQLQYSEVDYENIEYEQGEAPDFSREAWLNQKYTLGLEFPNLPYFIDGDFKLTETMAIHKYIADKWKPELLGKDAQHRGHISMLANRAIDFKNDVTRPCYATGSIDEVMQACQKHLPSLLDYMGTNAYLCGNEPSYVDFYFYEAM